MSNPFVDHLCKKGLLTQEQADFARERTKRILMEMPHNGLLGANRFYWKRRAIYY